tara:strand:- start:6754 stop:7311 length:558 start_codon:yes stop_codon:yes gene_type:complete
MKNKNYISNYINDFSRTIKNSDNQNKNIFKIYNLLSRIKSNNSIHIFGNGGSSSIASHFSMDLTNNSSVKCFSYNDPALITCYSNDFKFENWISRVIKKYGKKNDILILISSSGMSKNMINGLKEAKRRKFKKIITFTGFKKNNYLNKNGDINFWVDSNKYNIIENTHQFFLLMIVDMIKKFNTK